MLTRNPAFFIVFYSPEILLRFFNWCPANPATWAPRLNPTRCVRPFMLKIFFQWNLNLWLKCKISSKKNTLKKIQQLIQIVDYCEYLLSLHCCVDVFNEECDQSSNQSGVNCSSNIVWIFCACCPVHTHNVAILLKFLILMKIGEYFYKLLLCQKFIN